MLFWGLDLEMQEVKGEFRKLSFVPEIRDGVNG